MKVLILTILIALSSSAFSESKIEKKKKFSEFCSHLIDLKETAFTLEKFIHNIDLSLSSPNLSDDTVRALQNLRKNKRAWLVQVEKTLALEFKYSKKDCLN